jgi:biotin carboxyl carrier protein
MPLLIVEGKKYRVGDVAGQDPLWIVPVDDKNVALEVLGGHPAQRALSVRVGGRVISVSIQRHEDQSVYLVEVSGKPLTVTLEADAPSRQTGEPTIIDGPALVDSPMAGKIALVKTSVGSKVEEGQSLMVLEAMKMQNEIASPKTGIVKEIYVKHGDLVQAGDRLCLVG